MLDVKNFKPETANRNQFKIIGPNGVNEEFPTYAIFRRDGFWVPEFLADDGMALLDDRNNLVPTDKPIRMDKSYRFAEDMDHVKSDVKILSLEGLDPDFPVVATWVASRINGIQDYSINYFDRLGNPKTKDSGYKLIEA